jgi:hypothetical protein
MKYTNKYGLPETLVKAIGEPRPLRARSFSASEIAGPPYIRRLKDQHYDEITQDVSDMIWMLFGTAFHMVMEKAAPADGEAEASMSMPFGDYTITGTADLYHNGVVRDYKTTSVYSSMFGVKEEWITQLNVYRMLFEYHGKKVDKLEIHAILRDWQVNKAKFESDYPKVPYIIINVPIIDIEARVWSWILRYDERVPCSQEEKWARPTTYAVMKEGRKTAIRVLDTLQEAREISSRTPGSHVVERPGVNGRCEGYCTVKEFCNARR